MQTKINVLKFAAELRKRMKELQEQHKKDLGAYNSAIHDWRLDMTSWLKEHGAKRVARITLEELFNREGRNYGGAGFDASLFFAGAPRPPKRPSTQQVKDIRNTLRHLAITGRDQVTLDTKEVGKLLGTHDPDDDD
jgi:hypothetical protein